MTQISIGRIQLWVRSHRCDPEVRPLADRHYNRQKIGAKGFAPPGRCIVFKQKTPNVNAFWITSYPFAEFVKHQWAGAWICSAFRNESEFLSSDLIRNAVAATVAHSLASEKWGAIPSLGMVTFVDTGKTKRKRDPGRCYIKAGFRYCGKTKGGLIALQMLPSDMPDPLPAVIL